MPMTLLRAGAGLGAQIPPVERKGANEALREKGIQIDLSKIKPENLDELLEQLNDLEVNVDEDRAKVRVFCE